MSQSRFHNQKYIKLKSLNQIHLEKCVRLKGFFSKVVDFLELRFF